MMEFDIHYAVSRAMKHPDNQDPNKQQALEDALAMILASNARTVGPQLKTTTLANGVTICDIPMDLNVHLGDAVKQWRVYRDNLNSKELSALSLIAKSRLSGIQSARNHLMISDQELIGLAQGLRIPSAVLATRRTPIDIFRGLHFQPEDEAPRLPQTKVNFHLTYGQAIVVWGRFFGLTDDEMVDRLGLHHGRLRGLASGATKIPQDLQTLAEKMQEQFRLPPGVIYTRNLPEDVVAR